MPCPKFLSALLAGATVAFGSMPTTAAAQSLALSFEDGFDPQDRVHAVLWNSAVLNALEEAHVTTIFFPIGARAATPEGLSLIRAWGEAGHAIGNRGYSLSDRDASKAASALISDLQRSQALLGDIPGWTPRLRLAGAAAANAADNRELLSKWLSLNHYRSAPVSIDVSDGYYSSRYQAWHSQHPKEDGARFRNAYLAHLWNRANYYDQLSTDLLHRSVPHVMRLHTNAINASFLSDVIQMFRDNGWTIISPEKAYADRLYTSSGMLASNGISLLWSLARQQGVTGLRFPAEDGAYEKPLLDKVDFSQ